MMRNMINNEHIINKKASRERKPLTRLINYTELDGQPSMRVPPLFDDIWSD